MESGVEEIALVDQIPLRREELTLATVLALHPLARINHRPFRVEGLTLAINEILAPRALVAASPGAGKGTLAVFFARLILALVLCPVR